MNERSASRKGLFRFLLATVCVVCLLAAGYLGYWIYKASLPPVPQNVKVTPDRPFYAASSTLGFVVNPGRYDIEILVEGQAPLKFHATNDAQGRRIAAEAPCAGKPELWIFGCSYTWGWGLSDEETYPFLLQQGLGKYCVRNYGGNGYGSVHALVQLREELAAGRRPDIAVFSYGRFHKVRNVAAPSRLRRFKQLPGFEKFGHPRAALDAQGKLEITVVPIDPNAPGDDPELAYIDAVTIKIFEELLALCRSQHIAPVVALITRSNDSVPETLRAMGFHVVDTYTDLKKNGANLAPHDPLHPSASTNRFYAATLREGLKKLGVGE